MNYCRSFNDAFSFQRILFRIDPKISSEVTKKAFVLACQNQDLSILKLLIKKEKLKCPGNIPIEDWQRRLAMAPLSAVQKTFEATTQMAPNLEIENRAVPRGHYKSRLPFFKYKRMNDEFHSDTFFSVSLEQPGAYLQPNLHRQRYGLYGGSAT